MKNKIALLIATILLLGVFPISFAQNGIANARDSSNGMKPPEIQEKIIPDEQLRTQKQLIPDKVLEKTEEWRVKKAEQIAEKVESGKEFIENLSEEQSKVFLHLSRAQQKRLVEMNNEDALQAMSNFRLRTVNKDDAFKKREIAQEKIENAQNNYLSAKQNYLKAVNSYREAKSNFFDVKNNLARCNDDSDECSELREEAEIHSRNMIINSANMIIEHLNKIKEKANSSETMDKRRAEDIISEIKEHILEIETIIENAESAETKEEIKQAASSLSKLWIRIRNRERLHSAAVVEAHVWGIMKRSEHLEERLESTLAKMQEQGLDVSRIDEKITEFSEKIQDAKDKYQEAQSLIHNEYLGEDKETLKSTVDEAKELIDEAHELLQEAHKILVDIVKDIKSAGGEIEPEDENEEYEVVEEGYDDENEDGIDEEKED